MTDYRTPCELAEDIHEELVVPCKTAALVAEWGVSLMNEALKRWAKHEGGSCADEVMKMRDELQKDAEA